MSPFDSPIGPGYVHVYTGEGKGKTSAALGLALRAVGNGLPVLVIQFLKGAGGDGASGEVEAARRLAPLLSIRPRGGDRMVDPLRPSPEDGRLARAALDEAREELVSRRWRVVILDEIDTAVHFGLLSVAQVVALVEGRPPGVELVLTGRHAPPELLRLADLVTEMREVKHYYHRGVHARKGIER